MSEAPLSAFQSLESLKNRSFNCIYKYAQSTRDIALHDWVSADHKERALQLANFIKKDLKEFKIRLENLNIDFEKLPGKVRQHPHHPTMLEVGGRYITFIDDLQATVGSRVTEMIELLTHDVDQLNSLPKEQVKS